ncbi:OsmC family protein [Kitasatospora sp. MMS16-BH015]|uniref:hypothetical protein n=1 Tax=Kitasatospora sp. MMS16-BH015 TaxID=2018025 RepID=UPI000CA19B46|nr:hypothetical protein [Kitasatospora sp. MMS16-BH015]AUG76118.1 OsmC family protein [Kitasatospora sp. MMS16-BH015]
MRNGLNITGVSESVHEFRDNPQEAIADFSVTLPLGRAAGGPAGHLECRTRTLRTGTLRVARDFTLRHRPFGALGKPSAGSVPVLPTAYESTLAAVAACVLVTQVNGYTARGVNLGGLRVRARGRLALGADGRPQSAVPLAGLEWGCTIDCEAPTELLESVNRLVAAFSPNHQALLDTTPVLVSVHAAGPTGPSEWTRVDWAPAAGAGAGAGTDHCTVEADAVWEYGSEAVYRTSLATADQSRSTGPWTVDQAKQMLGIDKAPNSQEILLAALCAEVAELLEVEAARCGTVLSGHLTASGRLDTRGMMNVLREVPSRFHALTLDLAVTEGFPVAEAAELLGAALCSAVIPATLLHPLTVDIQLCRNGDQLVATSSSLPDTEALRDEITRRQQILNSNS